MSTETPAPAGWYPDQYPGIERWWNGDGWTEARRAQPESVIQQQVTVNPTPKRVSHLLHLILTILTAGLWLPVWIIIALAKS